MAPRRSRVLVRGVVQGVGFRPFVHALATGLRLSGHVTNTADGVVAEVEETPQTSRPSVPASRPTPHPWPGWSRSRRPR